MQTMAMQGVINDIIKEWATPGGIFIIAGDIILALIVILLAYFIARTLRKSVTRTLIRTERNVNIATLIGNLVRIGTYVAAAILILRIFGANWTSVVAAVGVLSLAVSLALQDVLKSFVAGIYLLLERPFTIGDTIVVSGSEGRVESVDVRTTILRGPDGTKVIVPNSTVFSQVVSAKRYRSQRLILSLKNLPLGTGPVTERVREILSRFPEIVTEPAPLIRLEELSGERIALTVDLWVDIERLIPVDLIAAMKAEFPEAEVSAAGVNLAV